MARLRLTFVATAGTAVQDGPEINASQEALFMDWLWARYAPTDAQGQPLTRNTANEVQAFRAYAANVWKGTRANVIAWKHELEKAAVPAPTLPQ